MMSSWTVLVVALAYVGLLFAIASYGDKAERLRQNDVLRPLIYALSLAIYCTSWTFFGSVGLSARSGYDFLPVYIGPILMLALGWPLLRFIVEVSKRQNITSIADFISARYGKNQTLGALVAVIAVIGIVPYISLQLKAVSVALETMLPALSASQSTAITSAVGDQLALLVALAMAGFAVLFGTRHIDATEHQHGMILAIAVESLVKLAAFIVIGLFVSFVLFGGFSDMLDRLQARPDIAATFSGDFDGGRWLTMTILSTFAIILLPRQFHVAVVENTNINDVRRAAWLLPLYLVAINLFVVPIAIAGLLTFGPSSVDADTFVLALPVESGHRIFALIAFVGGLSAATAMVIIETVALSIMVCNNIVVPILLSRRGASEHLHEDMGSTLIFIRRAAIVVILFLAYSYFQMIGNSAALAQTGLLSFAAVAQFAPSVFVGLIWRRATARGAMAGLIAGFSMWTYTLLLPSFADAGWLSGSFIEDGLFGLGALRPRMLLNLTFDPLTHGVLWSLLANLAAYIGVSLMTRLTPVERLQAAAFVSPDLPGAATPSFRLWRTSVSIEQLQETAARYLGRERARRSFAEFAQSRDISLDPGSEADIRMLRFTEHLLASAVGAASSRLVLALMLERHSANTRGAMKLLDDASAAIQYNRDLLQSAIDHVRQGIAVFDGQMRLICWNRQFRTLLHLPPDMGRVGVPLDEVIRTVVAETEPNVDAGVAERVGKLTQEFEPFQERIAQDGAVLEVRSSEMPDGGIVVTFADITERVLAAEALERRVEERTAELMELNTALENAKSDAEAANLGKTRFVAAASHDILQPLNAARLFSSSLVERAQKDENRQLVKNIDASLESVEEIFNALLEISRLDAGAQNPEISVFRIYDILSALQREVSASAEAKGLDLRVVPSQLAVRTDRRLLRRVLQNLLSNAIKYTRQGRVLMGCRRVGDQLRIEVHDTGPGIPEQHHSLVFREFERLDQDGGESGLGLGLSIVQRIANVLGLEIGVRSRNGNGMVFSITLPLAGVGTEAIATAQPPKRPAVSSVAGIHVLVVDNEPTILSGMESLLSGWGCTVRTACDMDSARAAMAGDGRVPDLIIADYHLRDNLDGLTLISRLRADAAERLPAILITADRSRVVVGLAGELDVIYMPKPVKPAALRTAIAHNLRRRQAAE